MAPLPTVVKPPRRRLLPVVAAAIALLVGALLIGLLVSGQKSPTSAPTFSATDRERAVASYYRLLPDRSEQAWTRLGRSLRADGKQQFLARWQGVSEITVISPPRSTGADSVHVGIELAMPDGSTVTEFHQHQVAAQGDRLVIASDTLLHRETTAPPPPPDDKKDKPGKDDEREDKSGKGNGNDDRKGEEDNSGPGN